MDFIERWLHISPDGGNGTSELLIATTIVLALVSLATALRRYVPRMFIQFLEHWSERENSDRFDN